MVTKRVKKYEKMMTHGQFSIMYEGPKKEILQKGVDWLASVIKGTSIKYNKS